ncbi:MAG: class I SAM-dependent DNA methyltransferase [Eubacteriales bacterium]
MNFWDEHAVREHYDLLIAEGNDPFFDPKPLRDYMDKWDGPLFLEALELSPDKTVLEIGVGTGRLAAQTAPLCKQLTGIDLSPATVRRAEENLRGQPGVTLYCGNFLTYVFADSFDVIYSSLTFLHIPEKQAAVDRVASLLRENGRFVLSIDKNPAESIDMGNRRLRVYPDTPENMRQCFQQAGLTFRKQMETEFAFLLIAQKVRIS